jgi:tRNA dimethylallyltransferase
VIQTAVAFATPALMAFTLLNEMPQSIAILGPTASGKSGIAVEIAKTTNGTVVNGDPFQAYKGISIGTGQPSADERQDIRHIGYGALPLEHVVNPADFGVLVRSWLDSVQKTGRTPILVTGSGLYLRGIWDQLDDLPNVPDKIVKKARQLCRSLGAPALHRYLSSVDPLRASQLHPNDGSRIQRALALHFVTGKRPSELLTGVKKDIPPNWRVLLIVPQRDALRDRIAKRIINMIQAGWQHEVEQLVRSGLTEHLRRLRPLGYDVWLDNPNPEKAEAKIIQATQAYAKRQVTWFNNQLPEATRLDPDASSLDPSIQRLMGNL